MQEEFLTSVARIKRSVVLIWILLLCAALRFLTPSVRTGALQCMSGSPTIMTLVLLQGSGARQGLSQQRRA
jgi:hypothetical protein